jgi:predicted transcriptional regulator
VQSQSRARIKLLVSFQPGLHLREIQRQVGLSFSSTRYHVDKLAREGELDRVEDKGYSRIYPPGTDSKDRVLLSLVRRKTDHKILSCFLAENNPTQHRLTEVTELSKSTISEHLATLLELGVVRTRDRGEQRTFELIEPAKISGLMKRHPVILVKATSRFIDLWDF